MSINERLHQAKEIYDELKSCKLYEFGSLKPSMIPDETPGVYAIYDKNSMDALYVGRTTNLRQRIYNNHLMGNLINARLKKYLINDNEDSPFIKSKNEESNG